MDITTHANGWGNWHAQGDGITETQAFDAIWAELEDRGEADEECVLVVEPCDIHPSCWTEAI